MDSHYDLTSNTESKAVENQDEHEYDFVETISPSNKAYTKYLLAKNFFHNDSLAEAKASIDDAIRIYKHLEEKKSDEWKSLSECYELQAEISEKQNAILLNANKKVVNVMKDIAKETQIISEKMQVLEQEQFLFKHTIIHAVNKVSKENTNLNYQIQVLCSRPQPSLMEHIAYEAHNKFIAIKNYSANMNWSNSIYNFFCGSTNRADFKEQQVSTDNEADFKEKPVSTDKLYKVV